MAMICPTCGARILDGASFCERCGQQVGIPLFESSPLRPQPTKDNKVLWIVAIVLIIMVVMPAVLYVMVLGFGGTSTETPTSSLIKSTVTGGYEFRFAPMSRETPWGDVTILLTEESNMASWSPLTTDLTNETTAQWNQVASTANLGMLKINMSIVDLVGNGYINLGDYLTLTVGTGQSFSTATTYTVTIMHDPSSAEICHFVFNGYERTPEFVE